MFENAEIRKNRNGNISYWKDGVLIGKRCTRCGEDKEISEFNFHNKAKGEYRSECNNCRSIREKKCRKSKAKITKRFVDENGIETRVNRKGGITYWKDDILIGKRCNKCGKDKSTEHFSIIKATNMPGSYCKECMNEKTKKWSQENYERKREQDRRYYLNNKEKVSTTNKRWRENNVERCKENRKKWRESNREKKRESNREWSRNNREKDRELKRKSEIKIKKQHIKKVTEMLQQVNPILKELDVKAYGYIYKITNIKTNHVYIGQTIIPLNIRYHGDVIKGWIKERYERDNQKFLEEMIEENFEVEDVFDIGICKYHLDKLESYWINQYDSYNNGYNNNLGNYKTDDGLEEFQQILSTHNLEYKDGKIIKKPTSTNEID